MQEDCSPTQNFTQYEVVHDSVRKIIYYKIGY